MSFGVGFGDIAKAIGLAKDLVTRYREAPDLVSDLATECVIFSLLSCIISHSISRPASHVLICFGYRIAGLVGVLEQTDDVLRKRQPGLANYQVVTLHPILQGYVTVLTKLRTIHNEYHALTTSETHGLTSQARKIGKRLTFDPKELKSCRDEIVHYNLMLNSFMTSLSA